MITLTLCQASIRVVPLTSHQASGWFYSFRVKRLFIKTLMPGARVRAAARREEDDAALAAESEAATANAVVGRCRFDSLSLRPR